MENLSRVFQKQTKKTYEEIEFHNSIQDFLLPFTGSRKVLEKMPKSNSSSLIKCF